MEGFLDSINVSVEKYKQLFDARLTEARANNLDKLDATIISRATQSSVDNVRNKVENCENASAIILAKTEKLLSVPTGGVTGKFVGTVYDGQEGVKVTVSGSGILRFVSSTLASQPNPSYKKKYEIMIDGKWINSGAVPVGLDGNVVSGGIRFNNHFKIHVWNIPHVEQSIYYSYTTGH